MGLYIFAQEHSLVLSADLTRDAGDKFTHNITLSGTINGNPVIAEMIIPDMLDKEMTQNGFYNQMTQELEAISFGQDLIVSVTIDLT